MYDGAYSTFLFLIEVKGFSAIAGLFHLVYLASIKALEVKIVKFPNLSLEIKAFTMSTSI